MLQKKVNNKWSFLEVIIGLMFCLVLMPSNFKAIYILFFGLSVLFYRLKKGWCFNTKLFFTTSILYFGILVTLMYSSNISYGAYKLQTMSSLLIFPLIFSMFSKEDAQRIYKKINVYLFLFILSVFLLNSTPFLWYWSTHYSWQEIMQHYPMVIQVDIGKYGIHPIYLSIYIALSILFSVIIFNKIITENKLLLLIINVGLIFFLFLYARKSSIIALLITLISWRYLIQNKKKRLYLLGAVIFGFLMVLIIPSTQKRFAELLSVTSISTGKETSSNIRYTIIKTSVELIKKSPVIGYGIGDYNDRIIQLNNKKGFLNIAKSGYNSHNQYLSFLLIGGIMVFMTFMLSMVKILYDSFKTQNSILILVLVFYSVSFFTENILEREDGVICFSFFLNFFALKNYYKIDEKK